LQTLRKLEGSSDYSIDIISFHKKSNNYRQRLNTYSLSKYGLCASSPQKWIEECLPQEYKRKYAKSELSSLSRNAKKVGKILVDNEGKSLAESSSYEISNIDNIAHIAHTQIQGRDRNQTLQKDTPTNLGISKNDHGGFGCIRGQELQEALLKA
jgi:hypothetical protein